MSKPEHEYYTRIPLKDSYDVLTVLFSAARKREVTRLIQEKYPILELMYFEPRRVAKDGGKSPADIGLWTVVRWCLLPAWKPLGVTIIALVVVMWLNTNVFKGSLSLF